jgi:5-methylcytosine-specific restriction endonuclease McrA
MDMTAASGLKFHKGEKLRVEEKRDRRLTNEEKERKCRDAVWRLYGRKCTVPGCKEGAVHQHHIVFRSRSVRLKYEPTNRAPICQAHHDLVHGGKIQIHPRTADGELLVTGERKYLEFKL